MLSAEWLTYFLNILVTVLMKVGIVNGFSMKLTPSLLPRCRVMKSVV